MAATGPDSAVAVARANRLRDSIGSSAGLVRNLFLSFLLLVAYIAVTIGSTTDEQLLRVSAVNLPILNIDLPIVAFYAVVPWLLVLFHFNLLLQLYLLARQLHLFNAAVSAIGDPHERAEQRARLFPFPFVQMIAGPTDAWIARMLFSALVWVTIVWVPLLLVISAQVRFLPYHDPAVTNWIRLAVLLDVVLLWVFWGFIIQPGERPAANWWRSALGAPGRWFGRIQAIHRTLRREEERHSTVTTTVPRAQGFASLLCTTVIVCGFSFLVAAVPGEPMERWVAVVLPAPDSQDGRNKETTGNLMTFWVFDGPNAPLRRNLQLAGSVLLAKNVEPELLRDLAGGNTQQRHSVLAKISGIDLAGRDLRFANLHGAIMPRANLRGANLDGADLRRADLSLADFRPVEIPHTGSCVSANQLKALESSRDVDLAGGQYVAAEPLVCVASLSGSARLSEARLTDATLNMALLDGVDLRDASLERVRLNGAVLAGARLGNANMIEAQLQFADLTAADLTRTILDSADIRRVKLSGALLKDTILRQARISATESANLTVDNPDLTGAAILRTDLRGARIQKGAFASFSSSDLRGAVLASGNFRGANFSRGDLRNADLSRADLRGANFEGANLSDAQFRNAKLDLAKFIRMSACRVDLSSASLKGAHFENAALQGATLKGTDLSYASLIQVDLSAVDLRLARLGGSALYGLRVDYGDLRSLDGRFPPEGEDTTLPSLARELENNDLRPTNRQKKAVAAAEEGTPLGDTVLPPAAFTRNAPVLCDETTDALTGATFAPCVMADSISDYIERASAAACKDITIASGIIHRMEAPPPLQHNRAGAVIGRPPVDEYSRMLAHGLTEKQCPALEILQPSQRTLIAAILERSDLAVPAILQGTATQQQASPERPACDYQR